MRSALHRLLAHLCGAAALAALAIVTAAPGIGAPASGHAPATAAAGTPRNVLLQADEAIYNTQTNVVSAKGHVEIVDGDRILLADSVSLDQNTNIVTASGHVSLLDDKGNVEFADKVELTQDMREGALAGFAALIGPNGRMAAVTGEIHQGRYLVGHRAVFTPCKVCREKGERTPLWQVKAVRVVHDNIRQELIYHDATFEFMGLPVFYTPYLTQADPAVKHKSGLLMPSFGSATDLGTFVRLPIYVALSDSEDLTIAPLLSKFGGNIIEGEYRQRWSVGGMWLQGSIGYNSNISTRFGHGPWLSHIFGAARIPITDIWRTGFDVALTSNPTYLKRYDISRDDRLVSDLFIEAIDGRSRLSVTTYFFQGLRAGDVVGQMPFVLPLAEYTYIPERRILGGTLRFDANALVIYRSRGEDDARTSVSASWRLPFIADNGQLLTFTVEARSDVYHTHHALLTDPLAPQNSQTLARNVALATAEWRWPFVAASVNGKTNFVVEPIVRLVVSPYGGNPRGIPDEDSASFEFDVTNLLRLNKFPGVDRWEGGPRADAGVRVSAIFPSGTVEALIGQEYRLKSDTSFAPDSGLGATQSDIVGRIKIEFPPFIDLEQRLRFDEQNATLRSNEVYVKAKWGRSSVNVGYVDLAAEPVGLRLPERKEINAEATLGVFGNWSVFGGARRDLETERMRDARFGIVYEDECFLASFGFNRRFTRDRDLPPSSTVLFRIGLKTVSGEKIPDSP